MMNDWTIVFVYVGMVTYTFNRLLYLYRMEHTGHLTNTDMGFVLSVLAVMAIGWPVTWTLVWCVRLREVPS